MELYHQEIDPLEKENLLEQLDHAEKAEGLQNDLALYRDTIKKAAGVEENIPLDDATLERLKALGYL